MYLTIEKRKTADHIIGEEFIRKHSVNDKRNVKIFVKGIINNLDAETYTEYSEEIDSIYNLIEGIYVIEAGDFNYFFEIDDGLRSEFKLMKKSVDELTPKEKELVDHVKECVSRFSKGDFPMDNTDFVEKVLSYQEDEANYETDYDFLTSVEKELHEKYNLKLVGDRAAGEGKHVFKK